ncbi:exopolyphosphatase [Klebsiella pneumoniae]|nr:exopolyphosphatase [Klebsiella pneumoniae]
MPINDNTPRPQEFAAVDLGSNSFHMVIARVVDGAMQIIGRLKQRVHLADGLDENSVLSEEAMTRGLNCLSLFAERLQGFSPSSVCIVGTHTLRQATNAAEFLKRAEKVIPYPIEIISGNEEARLIFMGVEHTQPERGRKLVIDIGGGSTELVIGEDFEPRLVESRRMGCVSFSQAYFPGGVINKENFQRARLAAVQKLETLAWQFRIQGWTVALGASGTIKAAQEVLVAMGEKDGFITPERLEMLVNELLKHKTSTRSVCPVSQKTVKRSLPRGWRSSAVCLTRWPSKNFVCPMARCAKVSCTRWKAASATRIFVAARHRVWQISTTSIANRRAGYWKLPPRCWSSGRSRIPSWPIRTSRRC